MEDDWIAVLGALKPDESDGTFGCFDVTRFVVSASLKAGGEPSCCEFFTKGSFVSDAFSKEEAFAGFVLTKGWNFSDDVGAGLFADFDESFADGLVANAALSCEAASVVGSAEVSARFSRFAAGWNTRSVLEATPPVEA